MSHTAKLAAWQMDLVRANAQRSVNEDSFFLTVAKAAEVAPSQEAIAKVLHTSQVQVSRWAKKGREVAAENDLAEVQSPYEIALRYSRGELTRDQVVDVLSHWQYQEWENRTAGQQDDLLNSVAGSFDELVAAHADGLLEDDTYDEIADGLEELAEQTMPAGVEAHVGLDVRWSGSVKYSSHSA